MDFIDFFFMISPIQMKILTLFFSLFLRRLPNNWTETKNWFLNIILFVSQEVTHLTQYDNLLKNEVVVP